MANPSQNLSTLRPDLSGSFMEYDLAASAAGYIGSKVLPVTDVQSASGVFGRVPLDQLLQDRETLRAPGSGYNRGNWTFEQDSYATQEHGAEEPVDDNEAKMYADYLNAEMISASRAYDVVMRSAEKRVADLVFDSGAFDTTSVTNEWDDSSNATPLNDVEARIQNIFNETGQIADTLIMSWTVYRNLRNCAQVIDRIASQGAGAATKPTDISLQMLAQCFDVQQVLVAGAQRNSAAEGQPASLSQLWSNEYVGVAKLCSGSDIRQVGLGRTFHWAADGSSVGGTVESYREEQTRSNIIRCRHQVDEKVLYAPCLNLLSNITT